MLLAESGRDLPPPVERAQMMKLAFAHTGGLVVGVVVPPEYVKHPVHGEECHLVDFVARMFGALLVRHRGTDHHVAQKKWQITTVDR